MYLGDHGAYTLNFNSFDDVEKEFVWKILSGHPDILSTLIFF